MLLDKGDEDGDAIENPTWTCIKAVLLLLLGTAMAAAFADPLVDTVHNFSNATNIPSFFISFIAMPLATNSSEAVSAIIFASRKKQRTLSLTFSEVCLLDILIKHSESNLPSLLLIFSEVFLSLFLCMFLAALLYSYEY